MNQHNSPKPSVWVTRWAAAIPVTGRILDLACGSGRHLRWLAPRGQPLTGIDIDLTGCADLREQPGIELHAMDLEQADTQLPDARYAGIIVTNYLYRPWLTRLPDYLDKDGVLIYETFAAGNESYGRPKNPDFLLQPDELLECFSGRLAIAGFEQGYTDRPRPAVMQKICAVNSAAD